MREDWEQLERDYLSPQAAKSYASKGRERAEEPCPIRTEYQRDRDRILHCKAFRRLKHKTQVFIAPEGDHYRTRLTHTLEVAQIARTIARALRLNEDLTEAIALGHDLGHTPFGHSGERAIQKILPDFRHNKHSLRVVDVLEKDGKGLNLTWEVRDGILSHSGEEYLPQTLEGQIVRIADRIAYVNHDLDDAIRSGTLTTLDVPAPLREEMGLSQGERINYMVLDIIKNSQNQPEVKMTPHAYDLMMALRAFLFAQVYRNEAALIEETTVERMIHRLYEYYLDHLELLPQTAVSSPSYVMVLDYIAGMSDSFALQKYDEIAGKRGR